MTERTQRKSGRIFFALFALCVLGAIAATVLMANEYRNLNLFLTRLGLEPVVATPRERALRPYELRGNRIARPKVELPEWMVTPIVPMETRFVRAIRKDPKLLCEALRRSGFANSGWRVGGFDKEGWECLSYREFPAEKEGPGIPSSAFLSIKGNAETRISSFRIKINLENAGSRKELTGTVIAALKVFLEEVRWEEAPEIFSDILALKEFDIIRFGNRIQLKKEFSETPRYNFLITPDRTRQRNSYLPDYFDRSRWLPLPDRL
jgi:hypothetical protein